MKYIKKLIFTWIILQTIFVFSQNTILNCEDEPLGDEQLDESIHSYAIQRNNQDLEKHVFNAFFHIIRNDNGDSVVTTQETTLEAIAMLNITFNQYDIYFKYAGFDYIDSTDLLDINSSEYSNLENLPEYRNDAFNLFIAETINGGSTSGRGRRNNKYSIYDDDYFISATLPHEIAHNFDLRHTSQNYQNSLCEHISGDNCSTNGDRVCDTPASHDLNGCVGNTSSGYAYVCTTRTDCTGDFFKNVPFRNFMDTNLFTSGNYYNNLRDHFTNGQMIRARETISADTQGNFLDAKTTVASLYDKYEGIYRYCCWSQEAHDHPPIFQPGFDYEFVNCSDINGLSGGRPLPWDYDDLSFNTYGVNYALGKFETNYETIKHINHTAIRILQLGNQPQRCYSNSLKNASSGTVVKFNDNIFNENVTITQKDSLGINNSNLIQNLNNGLYIIKKDYEDGTTDEKTILKNNN